MPESEPAEGPPVSCRPPKASTPARRPTVTNERGYRIGETHHRAKLTNHEVDLIVELRADGMSWRELAEKFEVSVRSVRDYCSGAKRSQTGVRLSPRR